ncbi:MAG: hypothetical protein KKG60_03635 [Nanoarchaeota archaeon]|nr:hypothetical protein [Nanoarchaeota archaeon]
MKMKCLNCHKNMKKTKFDIGYGIEVDSLHCEECGFNVTDDKVLNGALVSLKEQMAKEVKIIEIGNGIGIRFPNEIVKGMKLKRGREMIVRPEIDGLKLIPT